MEIDKSDLPMMLSCPVINVENLSKLGASLSHDDIAMIKTVGILKKFGKKSSLVYSGESIDSMVFLDKGLAKFVVTGTDGTEKTYSYFTPGCFIGDAAFFHRQPILFDLRFIEPSEVYMIDRAKMNKLLERPSVVYFLLTAISLVSRTLAMQLEDAAFRTTDEKVCRTLLCLSGNEHLRYKASFTHQELADLMGVHRVTVTNALASLKKEGIISMQGRGSITVLDREKLRNRILRIKK